MLTAPALFRRVAPAWSTAVVTAALAWSTSTASAFPIAAAGTEGHSVIVTSTADVIATYVDDSAAYFDDVLLNGSFVFDNHTSAVGTSVNLGSYAVGTELVFSLYVDNTGDTFYTGAASRNPDDHAHARVGTDTASGLTLVSFEDLIGGPYDYNDMSFTLTNAVGVATAVPEPSSGLLVLAGLGILALLARRSRRRDG